MTSEDKEPAEARLGVVSADGDGVASVASAAPQVVDVGQGERPEESVAVAEPIQAETPAPPPPPEEDFAALLAASDGARGDGFEPGQSVEGVVEVISLDGPEIFLDLGGKANGYVLKEEFADEEGTLSVKQGDVVKGVVVGTDSHGVRIRTRIGAVGGWDPGALEDAHGAGLPVEGKVVAMNTGGFEVEVPGGKAFCPMSHIDLYRPADPEIYVGQKLAFLVLELKQGGAVLSRAALLREERERMAVEIREKIAPGARFEGVVRNIQKFGAFVDLGGVDGLIHVSELAWGRVEEPGDVVVLGQKVEVVVLEVDEAADRISLSLRRAGPDPLEEIEGLQMGNVVDGEVVRLTTFGAFVQLAPGVDGLVHISDMAHHHVAHPKEVLSVGDKVRVKVLNIDLDSRRIGLSLKALSGDPWEDVQGRFREGQTVKGMVTRIADFGVFVELEPGLTALLPGSESGVPRGTPLQSTFKVGKEIEARVLRVDANDQKMALTVRSGRSDAPPPDRKRRGGGGRTRDDGPRSWTDSQADADSDGVGSLGALLAAALSKDEGDD